MNDILSLIQEANRERSPESLTRRSWKLLEELGEVSEAYLNVTSARNGKAKTWDDVREEVADVLIVAVDIALTPLTDVKPLLADLQWDLIGFDGRRPADIHDVAFEIMGGLGHFMTTVKARNFGDAAEWAVTTALSAVELATMPMGDQQNHTPEMIRDALRAEVIRKLRKWTNARVTRSDVTEFV